MSLHEITKMEGGSTSSKAGGSITDKICTSSETVQLIQKVIAEVIGTYMLIFAGCGSVVVNKLYGSVTFPGICVVWGLIVMVLIYSLGHISGAHFNPAVTITHSIFRRFPLKQVPLYILAQVIGSILASATLCGIFTVHKDEFFGTVPTGSNAQSLVIEIIISFLLMFVICGVATDNRAIGELAGLAVGMTILLNVFVAGPVSGASMNPARSLGPAVIVHVYKGLWIYIIGPPIGTIFGALAYHIIRFTDKPLREITKSSSFLKSMSRE
ncbi:putative aquaporin NIP-type [Castanea sativa]|uniref:putative aquaporin NIP-type n=1 Tax=Castanea sativa TaxID=21020 RepID=UPI003F653F29